MLNKDYAVWSVNLEVFFYKCFVQPAHSAAMRAELHRRSIAQMRVSYVSICSALLAVFSICFFFFGVNMDCFVADKQSVNSRHAYIWRSFSYSYCDCGARYECTTAFY